jgi:predicted transposase/invertase (TIGR01784 family)
MKNRETKKNPTFVSNKPTMTEFREKYVNPFTNFGFKRLFGEENNKDLLLDFLNELLKEQEGKIQEISYLPTERLPFSQGDRKPIFDIYCTNVKGEKFIVELQKTRHKYYKDHILYFSTFPIMEQAILGKDWNLELKRIYTIAILDFVFDEDKNKPEKYHYDIKLSDKETKKVFYDKLTFIYLTMPKFDKKETELQTKFDKWLFALKNLSKLERTPAELNEAIFLKLFETAEIANLNHDEFQKYQASINICRDINNSINTAREEGEINGKTEIAEKLVNKGFDILEIVEITGLTKEDVEKLKK